MDVGIQMVFATYGWKDMADDQAWDEEIRLARLADELGFDALWAVEHHFYDYSFCPDNLQLMAYLAAVCPNIDLGTAAVILPWNDPLRVAEKASVLDLLSKGRLRFGIGRGLARREFAAFSRTMDQSRERFDEARADDPRRAPHRLDRGQRQVLQAASHRAAPAAEIRLHRAHLRGGVERRFGRRRAKLGARMVMFADRPWPMRMAAIERHRELHAASTAARPCRC